MMEAAREALRRVDVRIEEACRTEEGRLGFAGWAAGAALAAVFAFVLLTEAVGL